MPPRNVSKAGLGEVHLPGVSRVHVNFHVKPSRKWGLCRFDLDVELNGAVVPAENKLVGAGHEG